ncbi:MAG: hypothetical protein ACREX3_05830, partial [Gammaproteobacteria bacterium]
LLSRRGARVGDLTLRAYGECDKDRSLTLGEALGRGWLDMELRSSDINTTSALADSLAMEDEREEARRQAFVDSLLGQD